MNSGHFGLVINPTKPDAAELGRALVERFAAVGWTALADETTADVLGLSLGEVASCGRLAAESAFVVVLGGDGTILRTARWLGAAVKPLAAINTGRLGFLTTAAAFDLDRFVACLSGGDYELSRRALLEVTWTGRDGVEMTATALNEATLTRGRQPRMIHVEARIAGETFNRYRGDGLVVSTPTGSTAYSLSAGGPLVTPQSRVFIVTPICSHTLADRSLVVADDSELELVPLGPADDTLLTLDGDGSSVVAPELPIRLRRASFDLPLVTFAEHTFFRVLQTKLGWSGSTV